MNELKEIAKSIQSAFVVGDYPQDFLDDYDQMECLAVRNGTETFLVRKKENGSLAVAKCYHRKEAPGQPFLEAYKDLKHPGLPRFVGKYQNDRILCVLREYIPGETLDEYMRNHQPGTEEILSVCDQLCDILLALHGHHPPIIHRDIKPENLILRDDGTLALIDFEISRLYRTKKEEDTRYFGTKGYAPPEQYGFGQTDPRTDIYSFGVLLRWMMTGNIRENPNISMPDGILRIIRRCTAFSPEERYRDISQVRQDLRKAGKEKHVLGLRRCLTVAAALILMACAGFAVGRFTDWMAFPQRVSFSEPLIERAVRLQLNRETGRLTEEDLAEVKRIYIYGKEAYGDAELFFLQKIDDHEEGPIRSLRDLTLLPQLEEVRIVRQGYVDVSDIADLPRLRTVELKHMSVSGIQPIAHLSRLREAGLFDAGLKDVSALSDCPWLETLDIGRNELCGFGQIGAHPRLRSLGMAWLEIKSLEGMGEYFPNVRTLRLQHCVIQDYAGLKELPMLETVYASPEQVKEIAAVLSGTEVRVIEED